MTPAELFPLPTKTLSDQLRAACILECTARKPGNVTPHSAFINVTYAEFVTSANVSAPLLAQSREMGVGPAIYAAVQATRAAVGTNTNLGMLLLLAPLAAIPPEQDCHSGIQNVLDQLDLQQTCWFYDAIRLAQPGGLGSSQSQDVAQAPSIPIVAAMAMAPHDRIARQYTHRFSDVLDWGPERFLNALRTEPDWETALIRTQLEFIANFSDSLILRKCGQETAEEAQRRAADTLRHWRPETPPPDELHRFDLWLRGDGHRRNPGTTADLLAAMLFALIRDGLWSPTPETNPDST